MRFSETFIDRISEILIANPIINSFVFVKFRIPPVIELDQDDSTTSSHGLFYESVLRWLIK